MLLEVIMRQTKAIRAGGAVLMVLVASMILMIVAVSRCW